jgi:hypothetical protein
MIDSVLAENIEKFSGALGSAVDFTLDQAPEIIQQAIYWNFIESIIYNLIGIALVIPLIFVCRLIFNVNNSMPEKNDLAESNKYWEVDITRYSNSDSRVTLTQKINSEVLFWSFAGSALLSVFSVVFINFTFIKLWIAPKLWLLEYASSLVK